MPVSSCSYFAVPDRGVVRSHRGPSILLLTSVGRPAPRDPALLFPNLVGSRAGSGGKPDHSSTSGSRACAGLTGRTRTTPRMLWWNLQPSSTHVPDPARQEVRLAPSARRHLPDRAGQRAGVRRVAAPERGPPRAGARALLRVRPCRSRVPRLCTLPRAAPAPGAGLAGPACHRRERAGHGRSGLHDAGGRRLPASSARRPDRPAARSGVSGLARGARAVRSPLRGGLGLAALVHPRPWRAGTPGSRTCSCTPTGVISSAT